MHSSSGEGGSAVGGTASNGFSSSGSSERTSSSAQMIKDLENICISNGLAQTVIFSGFDPHVAADLTKSVLEAKKDFPNLSLNYLGSIDHQVKGIHDDLEKSYYDSYVKSGIDDKLAHQIAKRQADDYIASNGMNDTAGTYAWSFKSNNSALDKYAGVAMNTEYAGDYNYFKSSKHDDMASKWAPIGCDTPKAVTDHELGHEIDKLVGGNEDPVINDMYDKMIKEGNSQDVLSGYSATNVKEFIAEAYSEYRNNPNPRPISVQVFKRLEELRDQKQRVKGLVRRL